MRWSQDGQLMVMACWEDILPIDDVNKSLLSKLRCSLQTICALLTVTDKACKLHIDRVHCSVQAFEEVNFLHSHPILKNTYNNYYEYDDEEMIEERLKRKRHLAVHHNTTPCAALHIYIASSIIGLSLKYLMHSTGPYHPYKVLICSGARSRLSRPVSTNSHLIEVLGSSSTNYGTSPLLPMRP